MGLFALIAKVGAGLLVTSIAADVGYRLFASRRIRHLIDNVPPFGLIIENRERDCEQLTIPVDFVEPEACQLAANLYLPAEDLHGLVVFCHELDGNRWTAMNYSEALVDSGYAVLSFDFRNHGDSCRRSDYRPLHWMTELEVQDVESVLAFARQHPRFQDLPIGLFGVSRGGCVALMAAFRDPQIRAVVTDSAYSTRSLIWSFTRRFSRHVVGDWLFNRLPEWHIRQDIEWAIRRSEKRRGARYRHLENVRSPNPCPVLLIAGSRDSYVTDPVTEHLKTLVPGTTDVWVVPKAKHNRAREKDEAEYDQRVVAHFQKMQSPS